MGAMSQSIRKLHNEKGEEAMEKLYPFALEATEVNSVMEAIQERISRLLASPASMERESHLRILHSLMEKLGQLLEQDQGEQALLIGMD